MDTSLQRLIVLSRTRPTIDAHEFARLYENWSRQSSEMRVSGALVACAPYFLQMIEGPDAAVRQVLAIIQNEGRHLEVHVIEQEAAASRIFECWTMTAIHLRGAGVDFAVARTVLSMFRQALGRNKDLPFDAKAMARAFERAIVQGYDAGGPQAEQCQAA